MGILFILGVCGFAAVLARIVDYRQSRSRYRRAQHDGCGGFMGWGEFCELASAGQGCLIISTLGHSRPMHRWHPQGELSAEELEEAYFDEVIVSDVLPPFWCHGSRWILQMTFPSIRVYTVDAAGLP